MMKVAASSESERTRAARALAPAVLCVDLDGTLLRGDLTFESAFSLLRERPMQALAMPFWLLHGRARFKCEVAARTTIDAAALPYDGRIIDHLRREREAGRTVVLATGSHQTFAEQVASHLELFDDVIATRGSINMSGRHKRNELVKRYGEGGFDYLGNESRDLDVWRSARSAWIANSSARLERRVSVMANVVKSFPRTAPPLLATVRALRPHQWLKNLLVLVPLVMAHRIDDSTLLLDTLIAVAAMCFVASSAYILNDLVDLAADRDHPTKRTRPFAAGDLSPQYGIGLLLTLLAVGIVLALLLPSQFALTLATYYAVTIAYNLRFKRVMMLDVMTLAGLYTLRIIAGGTVMGVPPSFWLLAFSVFLFLSLALVKRYAELLEMRDNATRSTRGRGYRPEDLSLLAVLGVASGFASVLVAALYINSAEVSRQYRWVPVLWMMCPLLLYWLGRVWLLTSRGEMHEDPVVFAVTDRASQLTGVLTIATLLLAT